MILVDYKDFNLDDYLKFYNIRLKNYKNIKIPINEAFSDFLKQHNISKFDFATSIFSLYLSRVDKTKGCLLKTICPNNKEVLLKIDYVKDSSFIDYMDEIEYIENFPNDVSFYSIYDATVLNNFNYEGDALSFNIYEDYLDLVYNDDVFLDIYMEHMAANIGALINDVLDNPNQQVCEVNILSRWDEELLEDFCYGGYIDFDRNKTLAMAFRENTSNSPDTIAIDDGINQITYGELESSTNSIAYDLNNNYDIGLGDNIALMLPRNYHFIELALSLNKIGATFVPVDSEYPLKRIEHMLNISEAKYMITTKEFADLHEFSANLIFIEDLNRDFDYDFECRGGADDVFAILFTSGTTGVPKGVTVSNKQVSGVAVSLREVYKSSPGDISGCYLSLGFGATFRMYFALYFAETVRIYNDEECDDILLFIESLKSQSLNDVILPPDLGITVYDYEDDFDVKNFILTGTKVNNLPNKDRGVPLFNMYGTSETLMAFIGLLDINADSAPIGKPLGNTWAYILDENKKQVPIGVLGDLYISRDFMSLGYYNRPDLTDKVFMDNPFSVCELNERMYHTGDVAFFNFDGEIDILGRSDDQLSVRGFRVESEEVMKIMKEFDSIADICLDVDNDNLVAYYTTTGKVDIDEVKNALENELPPYMVPSRFTEFDELPLNFNAKVDKFALRKKVQEMKNAEADAEIDDEVLKFVVDKFKEILKLDAVSVDDDFLTLGGNSLSAMKLQLQLKDKFDVNLPSNELMELSTPNNIADTIKANLNTDLNADESNYAFDDIVPLSESQLNVYLDESVNEMGTAYNNGFKIELNKSNSIGDIKNVIDKLFEVLPVLKARIINNDDVISFSFDAQVEIREGLADEIESFVRPFELDKSLSRFLIVENDGSNQLFMDCHHLIFDGTSLNNIFNQLTSILNGEEIDFVDNGVLRQISFDESLTSEYMDEASQFFDLMLADRDEVYELLPSGDANDADVFYDILDIDDDYLTSFLKDNAITHNQFFSSVFAYTLSRFVGSEKVLFKIIEDGRGHIDLSESVGMFVRTLPLLIDCKNQNVSSFLKDSASLINSTMKYDLYSFRILANKFDLSSNIYFQYAHSIFNNTFNLDVVELGHDPFGDFSFFILNSDENSYKIKVVFSDKYSEDMVVRFVNIYKLILHEMINVNQLADINYILEDDIKLLDSYNQTEHDLDYDDILDGFSNSLSKFPNNKLVLSDEVSYTYSEGAYLINEIQTLLKNNDIEINDKVCVLVERNHWVLLANMAVLSLGASYVPIDENLPDSRVEYMIEKSESKAIIVTDAFKKRADKIVSELDKNIRVINVSSLNNEVNELNRLDYVDPSLNGVACILFTSGTTGNPKAVQVGRFSITNMVSFYANNSNFGSDDVYGVFASVGFDVSLQHYAALLCGGAVTWVPNDIRLNIDELNRYFIKHGVTHSIITTQVSKLFVDSVDDTSIKNLCAVGEKMGAVTAPNNYTFVDVYGPTEATSSMTSINVADKIDDSSVGGPDWNTKIYVLDGEKRRVPFGASGELYISGYQVSRGYLNDSEKNNEAFFDNPFDGEIDGYSRMYKTGDVVRLLNDGTVGFIGRNDSQVKIRGNRVELTEIESTIRDIDYIDDITVQTVNNGSNKEVVAYVVTSSNMDEDTVKDNVCDYVAKLKPDYMVPSFVICLDKIPLNVNGKVDKRALPEVNLDSLHAEYVAPTNVVEKDIVEAFKKVFNQERISIYDDFIRLGGDSLAAIKLLAYLDDYTISAVDVLSLHTPYAIAKNIKKASLELLDVYSLERGCPLNESQLNIYLDIIAKDKQDSYLIPSYMEFSKDYDISSIIGALREILDAHPILKMCISDDYDVPYMVKGSNPSIIVDSNVSEDYISEFLTRPFDLHNSLSRFLIVENDDTYSLFAMFHHIIVDALSESIFKQDLQAILDGESIDIDDSFLKVSAFSQQIQKSDEYDEAKNFYDSLLADVDEAGLMLDCALGDGPDILINYLDLDFNLLKSFLDQHAITENILFTSAFAYNLSRFVGNDKIYFNIAENGRDRFNNYRAIGMHINTLPIFVDCKNQYISSFMKNMADLIYDVMRYNYYPFRVLVNEYNIDSNILFNYLPEWINHRRDFSGSIQIEEDDLIRNMNDLISDFHFEVIKNDEKYILRIIYSDKYSNDFIKRFAESYNLILQDILSVDKLGDINYITPEDIELLDSYNHTEHDLMYGDVLDAFNENLSKYPNNNLVSFKDVSYTYCEGAFIADRIAKKLIELGISKNDCVGFLTERNEYYMFCELAIMSCGAIYVPLDDKLPDDRIKFMLSDTESKVIIVSDETYNRVECLSDDYVILNISEIINGDIGTLSSLPIVYNDLACILYTSGTTGTPKGVNITRKSVLNVSTYYVEKYGLNNDDVYALFSAIGFDVSNFVINAVLYSGARLSVIPEEIRLNMDEMNNYFIKQGVTHAFITTQVGKLFMQDNEDISLKVLLVAGEKLGKVENPQNYELIDGFGPTEAFAFVSSINNKDKIHESSVGFLNYNSKAYILDDELRQVPIGAVGELCLAGYQIADGYLNRDEETSNAFIDNPFGTGDYGVLYRTGDMVRLLDDGSLGIVGRRDSQVKIRGNRVELSEIEAVIRDMEYINDVTVQTIKNGENNELVAYVVASDEIDDIKDYVCDNVSKIKPDYMVPSFVIKLENIPLNINGKVDKRSLPEVNVDGLHVEYVAPTTETEKLVVDAFEGVFNQKGIGLYDDFVRLGGDSIKAIRVISILEKNGLNCSARDILNNKTPYLIAQNVEKTEKISYGPTVGKVDLLPIQSYFFDKVNNNEYSQEFIVKSRINLDLNILQKAFDELTNIHDMLRVKYEYQQEGVVQEILPLNTRICEIKEYETQNFKATVGDIIKEDNGSLKIDGDLIKISLVHYNNESYIIFVIHHLIIDGVSWSILMDDLTYIYTQIIKNNEIDLLRPYPYKNWVNDVEELVGDISEEEKQHWVELNSLLDNSSIRGKYNRFYLDVDAYFDADNPLMLSEEEYLALSIARAYKKTYGKDIIFNRESYGRDESIADVKRTVGWFTSQYPILVKTNNKYDEISLMEDVYTLKDAYNRIEHLGLNYGSLIYTTKEFEFINCPVTFNFLSTEFLFKNSLFESINFNLLEVDGIRIDEYDFVSEGIELNISRVDDLYLINGDYPEGTYLGDKFSEFIENIKFELKFIGEYKPEVICCALSESQLGVYLDENVGDKNTAYSVSDIYECGLTKSVDEIKTAIANLIDKHPILKGRVVDEENPLLLCDSYPSIEVVDVDDYSDLIKPFNLNESLARFYIIDNGEFKSIFYDLHHIICDATSRTILNQELSDIFEGNFDSDVDLAFVNASIDSFNSKYDNNYDNAEEFFKRNLSDIDEVNYLVEDSDGFENFIQLPIRGIRNQIEDFAHECGITKANLFNAIFAYALSRFTGSDKVYFNFTEHGRHEDYTENALGMFVRTIPIVVNCENTSIKEYLANVSDLILESMKNSIVPFRKLAREFDLNNNVAFEYNFDLNDVSDIGTELIIKDSEIGLVSDFLCYVNDLSDGYLVSIQSCDKYSNETVIRFLNTFKEILIQIFDKKNLSDIDYICNSDLELLDSYNQTEHDLKYSNVIEAFNEQLSNSPDNILTISDDVNYSFAQSAYLINQISLLIEKNNISCDDKVVVFVDRNHWVLLSALSCISKSVTYVPIDENYPDKRIVFMIQQSASKAIITTDTFQYRVENIIKDNELDLNIINISHLQEDVKTSDYIDYVDTNDVVCILYTSGTTGIPKAVQMTHLGIINLIEYYVDSTNFTSSDVQGIFASVGFDVSLEQFVSVFTGGSVTYVPNDVRLNIDKLNEYFIKHNVTHTLITTQIAKLFVKNVSDTSLKYLQTAGEKLGAIEVPRGYILSDVYGPTEANYITSIDVDKKIEDSSVGFLNWNTKTYILDNEMRRIPMGAVGELYILGYQTTSGYLDNPEENKKTLSSNIFDENLNGYDVMYKTGDLARYLPDGSIGIVGRADSQVKIRGNRVELSEIEVTIREIGYVEDVTVQTIAHDGNNELVAYVVLNDNFNDDFVGNIQNYILDCKPDYMVPAFVVQLDEIPVNVNGKVDKRALPVVDLDSLRAEYVAPTNDNEELIVNAFEKVFNQDKISILDDFVVLGGNSLTAIKLLSLLGDTNITAADILSLKTPKQIANHLTYNQFDLDVYSLEEGCPLTETQLNVYLDIIIHEKKDSYHLPYAFEIPKKYSVEDIIDALEVMFEVHPILGMCVSEDYEVPCMVKGAEPSIQVVSNYNQKTIDEFLFKRFNLYDSLCRFLIVENEDNYLLFAVFHHLIFDEYSKTVFKENLISIIKGESVNKDESFLKVAAFNKQIQKTQEYQKSKEFYDSMLDNNEQVGILLDCIGGDGPAYYSFDFDINFNDFLSRNKINKNVFFTSVFAYTLSRFVGTDNALFYLLENGRDRLNNFDSIGMFVNVLPILVDCKNQETSSFMHYMEDLIYNVMKNNYYPFRKLAEEYLLHAGILFQYLPYWIANKDNDLISISNEYFDVEDVMADFVFYILENRDNYSLNVMYSKKYSHEFIKRFTESYMLILHEIIDSYELADINYISNSDLMLLKEYNQTEHDLKYDDILDVFNENLSKYPNNKLVSFKDVSYTYSESAFIADKIVKILKDYGVNNQEPVAFLVECSDLYMFCVLAILSAGSVFVPLDDANPDERLKHMLDDTQSNVVIVSNETYERGKNLADDNVVLLNINELIDNEIGNLSSLPVNYGDLACILYTSGTTGVPKGVNVTRQAIINLAEFYVNKYSLSSDDVFGQYSSIGFDAGFKAIFAAIYAGACLDIIPNEVKLDMVALNNHFIKQGINHVDITTPVAKLLIKQIKNLPLDVLFTGGEKLGEITNEVNCRFVDGYGPTEAYVEVTTIDVKDRIDSSSIGYLIDNNKAYILDNELRPIPIGATGELFLAGSQIADGYLNREEETDNAFLENPFDGGKMYRTGDMVRILPDETLAIVGRRDSQVKIRGNRVELSEVEAVIRELDYVDDVLVQVIKNGDNYELVAYVVPTVEIVNLKDSICDYVYGAKPDYMVPSFVIKLDSIPMTINGKVDKQALPEVDLTKLREKYVAPTNDVEKQVVEAFEEIFGLENVSIYDDFVVLGGNSLTAIKLRLLLNIDIHVTTLFKARTPYKIAQYMMGQELDYGFELVKKGTKNQNMFILPPGGGSSFILLNLVNNIDFDGNVYLIDDFKHYLTLDEIKTLEKNDVLTLNHYYEAIKDIFQDGDIIAGYSLGCIYAALLCERLENTRKVDKCIFIDMPPRFANDQQISREDAMEYLNIYEKVEADNIEEYSTEFNDKLTEIFYVNYTFNFHIPEIESHIITISTFGDFNKDLDYSSDTEFIPIDSTHEDIVGKDVYKIKKYFK